MISFIVAMSENRVIGVGNRLPWHIPEDLKRFKRITSGHPVIMGRKTFDSIGKPLPGRANIVITRNKDWAVPGVLIVNSLDDAITLAEKQTGSNEIFILGGGQIFQEALPRADRIYLTIVHTEIQGDTYFPEFDAKNYKATLEEKHSGSPSFTFRDLERN